MNFYLISIFDKHFYLTINDGFEYKFAVMDSTEKIDGTKAIVIQMDNCEIKSVDKDGSISVQNIEIAQNEWKLMKSKRSKSLDPTYKLDGFNPVRTRISSIMSLGDLIGDAILTDSYGEVKNGKWY